MPEARRRGLPAQAHVVALVVTLFLPLALAAAALLWHAAEAERDRSRQDALGLARRLAADVDRELDGVVLTLQALATSPALQAGDLATFAAQARAVPGFRGGEIVLSDRAGRPLVSAGAPEAPLPASAPAELGEAAAAVFASGAPLVSDLPAEVAGGRFLLLVEVPARRDGAVAFALGVILPPARLSEALAADLPSPAWTAAVVDRQGRIVVRSREAGRPAAGLAPEDARRDATEPEGLGTGATPDGTPVLVAYARPRLAPWRVEDEVPAALVEAPLRRLWWLLAGMAPVLGLATAAAGWWGGRLSREVRRLAAAAAAIERGEPVRPVASPVREINGIGEALAVAAAERATAEAALRESERRFRDFAEAGSDWFWETDAEHRFVWQSANVGRTSGVPAEWAYGKTRLEIAAPDTDPTTLEAHRRTLEAHRPFRDFEYLRRGPLGDLWLSTSGVPVLDEAGRLAGYRGIGRDITATKRAEAQVQRLAHHDPLTGLPNRVLFRDRFGQALALAGRGGGRLAVLLLDLDDFKGVNDTLGHPTGDALLRGIAGRLGGLVRGGDTLARLGGDEFALVQVGARQPADAAALAARLLAALEAPFDLDGRAVHVAASLGIALYPEDGADPDELLKNADLALYRAKAEDRGRFRFFEPAMEAAVRARRELEAELRHGLERGEFTLVYQPQLDLRTGAITGVEALLRWRHPTRGLVPPGEFVPAAEASGLIVPLGAWVLREACRQAAAWRAEGLALTVAVNVSPVQLRHPDLLDVVDEALAASGLEPGRLELEVTEGILVVPEGGMAERIAGLGERGVRLAIDDFGTGYSSLAYLRRLPARRIKVDRSFVGTISTDPEGEAVVRAIVSLGHALGKEVVAEGVETEAQLAFLRELGCDAAQGFLLARPRPAAEVERLLAA